MSRKLFAVVAILAALTIAGSSSAATYSRDLYLVSTDGIAFVPANGALAGARPAAPSIQCGIRPGGPWQNSFDAFQKAVPAAPPGWCKYWTRGFAGVNGPTRTQTTKNGSVVQSLGSSVETGAGGIWIPPVTGYLGNAQLPARIIDVEEGEDNAAAVFLGVNTLAIGREVVISRGELVEIGDSFRIPDVMTRAGGRLREVGTTNRTHLADYERAIGPETALILKVHRSNFQLMGFTADVDTASLAALARQRGLPVMEDLGSGALIDLSGFGLRREPLAADTIRAGVDVVTFSGDKLLGGPQAGILVVRRELLARCRRNPQKDGCLRSSPTTWMNSRTS